MNGIKWTGNNFNEVFAYTEGQVGLFEDQLYLDRNGYGELVPIGHSIRKVYGNVSGENIFLVD